MKLITIFFLFMSMSLTYAQKTIKGYVSDHIGPLEGANILIKNSTIGTVSNIDGYYEIEANYNDTLSISYLGYSTKDILVANQKMINTVLDGEIQLKEVQIVAYGTIRCTYRTICQFTKCNTVCGFNVEKINPARKEPLLVIQNLYPNPSKDGRFAIKLLHDFKNIQIQVANISGQIIKTVQALPIHKKVMIDLSQYAPGIYIINIIADGKRLAAKKAVIGR